MTDREQSHISKREMDQKPQRGDVGMVGQSHGGQTDREKEREHGIKRGGTVGRDVPDLSRGHNTEIAVEAGRKGKHPGAKP